MTAAVYGYLFYLVMAVILLCGIILLIMSLRGKITLSRARIDKKYESWYQWQVFGLTVLIKDMPTCIFMVMVLVFVIVSLGYIFGFEPIF